MTGCTCRSYDKSGYDEHGGACPIHAQPNTTPIKDIKEIISFAITDGQNQVHDLRDGRATPEQIEERMFESLEFHAQAIQTYIDERILEARIDELEYVSSDIDGWLFTTADGKEQDVQDRIKELKSNQSKG